MKNVEILYKSRNLIVVKKPSGVPSQPDPSGDADALTLSAEALSLLRENDLLYPINRLDRVVGGILVFARNKRYAAALSEMVGGKGIEKEYLAVVSGEAEGGRIVNYLYKDARMSKSFVVERPRAGVKEAILDYLPLSSVTTDKGEITLIRIKLLTGRYHQIRCQMSHNGTPIIGDGKYGSRDRGATMPALFSYGISLSVLGEDVSVVALPDGEAYPWNLFPLRELLEDKK